MVKGAADRKSIAAGPAALFACDVVITMPRGWRQKAVVAIDYQSPIPAPVVRGTTLGQLTVRGEGVPEVTVPLLAGADVGKLGLPGRAMAVLTRFLSRT